MNKFELRKLSELVIEHTYNILFTTVKHVQNNNSHDYAGKTLT